MRNQSQRPDPRLLEVRQSKILLKKYKDIDKEKENQSEWGTGEQGYKRPKSPVEKLRSVLVPPRGQRTSIVCFAGKIYHTREYTLAERSADRPLTPRNACSTNSGVIGPTFNRDTQITYLYTVPHFVVSYACIFG